MSSAPVKIDMSSIVPLSIDKGSLQPLTRMVSPKGETIYLDNSNSGAIADKQKQGYTRINPDGSFYLQNIHGEDPLDEAKRREIVFNTLTSAEKQQANAQTLKEFGTTGIKAALATGSGVTGASGLGSAALSATAPTVTTTSVGTGVLGATGEEIMKDVITYGPSVARQVLTHPLAQKILLHAAGVAGGGAILKALGVFGESK